MVDAGHRSKGFNIRVPPNNSSTQYFNPALQIHHFLPGFFNKPSNPSLTLPTWSTFAPAYTSGLWIHA